MMTQGLYCSPRLLVAQQSRVGSGSSTGTGSEMVAALRLRSPELRSGTVPAGGQTPLANGHVRNHL